MFLRQFYFVHAPESRDLAKLDLPIVVALSEHTRATFDRQPPDREPKHARFRVVMETRVDPGDLELVEETGTWREREDGSREDIPAVGLKGNAAVANVSEVLNPLSFLTDVPFSSFVSFEEEDAFVPETEEDRAALEALGTARFHARLSSQPSVRSVWPQVVNAKAIEPLLPKGEGLQLYTDALSIDHPVGRFREFWRVLESAFGAQNEDLLGILEQFEPAREIGFREHELRILHVLRGRASHARSKRGVREVRLVTQECRARLPRLKSLVERVIVTKKTWGAPTIAFETLFPLAGYVGPGEEPHLVIVATLP
jgi:hypothetical protein